MTHLVPASRHAAVDPHRHVGKDTSKPHKGFDEAVGHGATGSRGLVAPRAGATATASDAPATRLVRKLDELGAGALRLAGEAQPGSEAENAQSATSQPGDAMPGGDARPHGDVRPHGGQSRGHDSAAPAGSTADPDAARFGPLAPVRADKTLRLEIQVTAETPPAEIAQDGTVDPGDSDGQVREAVQGDARPRPADPTATFALLQDALRIMQPPAQPQRRQNVDTAGDAPSAEEAPRGDATGRLTADVGTRSIRAEAAPATPQPATPTFSLPKGMDTVGDPQEPVAPAAAATRAGGEPAAPQPATPTFSLPKGMDTVGDPQEPVAPAAAATRAGGEPAAPPKATDGAFAAANRNGGHAADQPPPRPAPRDAGPSDRPVVFQAAAGAGVEPGRSRQSVGQAAALARLTDEHANARPANVTVEAAPQSAMPPAPARADRLATATPAWNMNAASEPEGGATAAVEKGIAPGQTDRALARPVAPGAGNRAQPAPATVSSVAIPDGSEPGAPTNGIREATSPNDAAIETSEPGSVARQPVSANAARTSAGVAEGNRTAKPSPLAQPQGRLVEDGRTRTVAASSLDTSKRPVETAAIRQASLASPSPAAAEAAPSAAGDATDMPDDLAAPRPLREPVAAPDRSPAVVAAPDQRPTGAARTAGLPDGATPPGSAGTPDDPAMPGPAREPAAASAGAPESATSVRRAMGTAGATGTLYDRSVPGPIRPPASASVTIAADDAIPEPRLTETFENGDPSDHRVAPAQGHRVATAAASTATDVQRPGPRLSSELAAMPAPPRLQNSAAPAIAVDAAPGPTVQSQDAEAVHADAQDTLEVPDMPRPLNPAPARTATDTGRGREMPTVRHGVDIARAAPAANGRLVASRPADDQATTRTAVHSMPSPAPQAVANPSQIQPSPAVAQMAGQAMRLSRSETQAARAPERTGTTQTADPVQSADTTRGTRGDTGAQFDRTTGPRAASRPTAGRSERDAREGAENTARVTTDPREAPQASPLAAAPGATPAAQPASPAAAVIAAVRAEASWAAFFRTTQSSAPAEVRSLRIQLNPVDLGEVTAHLKLDGDVVSVEITASTEEARRHLATDSDTIARSLRALGLDVDRVTVQASGRADPQPQADQGAQRQQGPAPDGGAGGAREQGGGSKQDRQAGHQTSQPSGTPLPPSGRSTSDRYI
jgi:chemotaxis protein MotD